LGTVVAAALLFWGVGEAAEGRVLARKRLFRITSQPANARVFLNGEELGYTPLDDSLSLGIGDRIQAYAYGFVPWVKKLTSSPESDLLSLSLKRQLARLAIRSNQLSGLGAEVRAYFADRDTVFSGFINIGRGRVAYEGDVFVGRYRLEIDKPGYKRHSVELFVPPQGKLLDVELEKHPLPLTAINVGDLREVADEYRADCGLLLAAGMAIGDGVPNVEAGPDIRLADPRLRPFLQDLADHCEDIRELSLTLERAGERDLQVLRTLSQAYVYQGVLLGKQRRFAEAHALFEAARELSPFPVDREPSPLPGHGALGELMSYSEGWYRGLGRVDVVVNPRWTADRVLRTVPLRLERVMLNRREVAPPPRSAEAQAMCDSLILLAEAEIASSVLQNKGEFSLLLPRGHYLLRDDRGVAVPSYFLVDDPTLIRVDPHVNLWLPALETPADTVRIQQVVGNELGPLVKPEQVAFGREYSLVVDTKRHRRREERVVFYESSFARPIWPGVTAVAAEPGVLCTYLRDGPGRLQAKIRRRGILKFLLLPVVAAGVGFAL